MDTTAILKRSSISTENDITVAEPLTVDESRLIVKKRRLSSSTMDYACLKKFKENSPECDQKQQRLVVSPSSPTHTSYILASPFYSPASSFYSLASPTYSQASPLYYSPASPPTACRHHRRNNGQYLKKKKNL
ncbi:Hypothetical protein CINCED_3A012344 [Cinara cedri]|uniref:Uncharacterized protein n=1 Tax=Cinara cedri TaxID=506608 RepID=A0A5E4NQ30_9HEMI|nr:Hypothetical protein CINCED_3A012344 [Cinara cedri]